MIGGMEKGTVQEGSATSSATPPAESGKVAAKQELFMCPECGRPFKKKATLVWHMQRLHPDREKAGKNGGKSDSMAQLKPEDIVKIVEERIAAYMDRLLNATGPSPAPSRKAEEPGAEERLERGGISVSEVEVPEKPILRVPINVEPEVVMLFRWWNGKAKPEDRMSFSEWVNEVVKEHFYECLKVESAIIVKRR